MSAEAKPKRSAKASAPLSMEQAREQILAKLSRANTRGALSFFSPKTLAANGETIERALVALETEGAMFVDRRKAKPKYFACEFKPVLPDRESVGSKIVQFAARKYPELLTEMDLKRSLATGEKGFFPTALDYVKKDLQLIELKAKTKAFYIDAESLRAMLSMERRSDAEPGKAPRESFLEQEVLIVRAYRELVQNTHFSNVPISSLQHASGVSLPQLKEWLLAECAKGRADLSYGDWSLADESKRSGAIEIDGERFLLVRLLS